MRSHSVRIRRACSLLLPQASASASKAAQTFGRRESPNSLHRLRSSSCTQRTPAGLPSGMPGMGEEIDGAMQQAPQPIRHCMDLLSIRHQDVIGAGRSAAVACAASPLHISTSTARRASILQGPLSPFAAGGYARRAAIPRRAERGRRAYSGSSIPPSGPNQRETPATARPSDTLGLPSHPDQAQGCQLHSNSMPSQRRDRRPLAVSRRIQ